jgi:hypothetical protein
LESKPFERRGHKTRGLKRKPRQPVARIIIYKGGWTVGQYRPEAKELTIPRFDIKVGSFAI